MDEAAAAALTLPGDGKTKRIERQLSLHCHQCRVVLVCPPDKDFWAWSKCGDALDFKKAHDHGNPRLCGAEIKMVERDD